MAKKMRKWPPEKVAEVLAFRKTHSYRETLKHFAISSGQLHVWQSDLPPGYYSKRGKAKREKQGNGLNGIVQLPEKDALMWLERWRQAYFDRVKAETPLAADVLAALRGGK